MLEACVLVFEIEGESGEVSIAGDAVMFFEGGVSLQMGSEIGLVCEGSRAVCTYEGFFSGVGA